MSDHSTDPRQMPSDDATDETMNPTQQPTSHDRQDDTTVLGDPTLSIQSEPPFRVEPDAPVPDDVVAAEPAPPSGPPAPDPSTRQPDPAPYEPPLVTVHKGPRPGTVLLGLLALIVAGYVLATNLTGAEVDLARSGPFLVGGLGVLLLLVGIAGVLLGRRR